MLFNVYPYLNVNDLNLDFILQHVKSYMAATDNLESWRAEHEVEYTNLKKMVDDLDNGNWSPEYITAITNFFSEHLVDIVGELVKQVFFGVTDDGHFVAYIPERWNDIIFGTSGYDDFPTGIDYGHLTLSY